MTQIRSGMATTAPVGLSADRYGNLYGINGVTRGFRYTGATTAQSIGITVAATVRVSPVTPAKYYVSDIVIDDPGANYISPPTVSVQGVSSVRIPVRGGALESVAFPWSATTHTAAPPIVLTGGQATGGVISLRNTGSVAEVEVNPKLEIYSSSPAVTFFANTAGVTGAVTEVRPAKGRAILSYSSPTAVNGMLASVVITDGGQYVVGPDFPAGASPVGVTATAGIYVAAGYSAATYSPQMTVRFSGIVSSPTVTTAGTEYTSPPDIAVMSYGPRRGGGGAVVECAVDQGGITSVEVVQAGSGYDGKVTAVLSSPTARASASIRPRLAGRYLCAIRYSDSTPESRGGPNYGNTCELQEVDCGDGAQSILWTNLPQSNPEPGRITHLELWRTTADQAITLYRVARYAIASVPTEYIDDIPDTQVATGTSSTPINVVTDLTIVDDGSGYSSAPTLTISGGGGSGATGLATVTKKVGSFLFFTNGTGYTSAPTVVITGGGGSGASATANVEWVLTALTVTNGGSGYSSPPTVLLNGEAGYATANIGFGEVLTLSLYPPVPIYTTITPPTVTFVGGGGTGAAATATVDGRVGSLTLTNGGSGYTGTPSVTLVGGGGTGANAVAFLNIGRSLHTLTLTSRGSGFTSAPSVTLSGGGGSGATATATIGAVFVRKTDTVYTLPILTEEGYPSSERFTVPPSDMAVMCFYQDRAWYAVSATRPNTLCFSEVDEPESVPAAYEVTLQQSGNGVDAVAGMFVMDGALYVAQARNMYRVVVAGHPLESTTANTVAQRGIFNNRCYDIHDGVAYAADSFGVYAFNGSAADPLSDAIGNYWSDALIDFSESKWFSVAVDPQDRVVRFYFKQVGDSGSYPKRAMCYSLVTKAWWTESYAHAITAPFIATSQGRERAVLGTSINGLAAIAVNAGAVDYDQPVPYALKTGKFPLNTEPRRGARVTYTPTAGSHVLGVSCYYNASSAARPNAISSDIGAGVVSTQGSTTASMEMNASRSALAPSTGVAQLNLSGRIDDRSVGGDKDISFEFSGTQSTSRAVIHKVEIDGAGA